MHHSASDDGAVTPSSQGDTVDAGPELVAYPLWDRAEERLAVAPATRDWMNATYGRVANRCLPLLIANQSGWLVLNSHAFRVTWDGGETRDNLDLTVLSGAPPYPVASIFGHGIVTFYMPCLFRTSPGYNLLVRGPANLPKDGAAPLEGVVETDWAVATFTMNWQLTRAGLPVTFDEGEPICMLVPQRRGELERIRPRMAPLDGEPAIAAGYGHWATSRHRFQTRLARAVPGQQRWQMDYFNGTAPGGIRAAEHQRKLRLRSFVPRAPGGTSKS